MAYNIIIYILLKKTVRFTGLSADEKIRYLDYLYYLNLHLEFKSKYNI